MIQIPNDKRVIFDCIPEQFDKFRPRYCPQLFEKIIKDAGIDETKSILEIGPGTGQATEPFLKTGCHYEAIELGHNFFNVMKDKFSTYKNFHITNGDFEKIDFGENKFDLIYSATTIQWIPQDLAYNKCFRMLKKGGTLAMFMTRGNRSEDDQVLNNKIQEVYKKFFITSYKYDRKFNYDEIGNYGFTDINYSEWKKTRIMTADEYISYIGTHCDHIALIEPYKSEFYKNIHKIIMDNNNKIEIHDLIVLYTGKK